jgi:hypothetical protein
MVNSNSKCFWYVKFEVWDWHDMQVTCGQNINGTFEMSLISMLFVNCIIWC